MDGSMLDSGKVGAVVVWWGGAGSEGRPYYLERNKEVYDAEVYTIYRALKIFEQRGESNRLYTVFSDSAPHPHRQHGTGPAPCSGHHEVSSRITSHGNAITVRRTPAHQGVEGNKTADT